MSHMVQKSRLIFLLYFLSQMFIPSLSAGSLGRAGTVSTGLITVRRQM